MQKKKKKMKKKKKKKSPHTHNQTQIANPKSTPIINPKLQKKKKKKKDIDKNVHKKKIKKSVCVCSGGLVWNNFKSEKNGYLNKRWCIIDCLMWVFLQNVYVK